MSRTGASTTISTDIDPRSAPPLPARRMTRTTLRAEATAGSVAAALNALMDLTCPPGTARRARRPSR